jgi:HEAT repeat protein
MTMRFGLILLAPLCLPAQTPAPLLTFRELVQQGPASIPKLEEYLKDPAVSTRVDAVKALVEIGTAASLEPLVRATSDNDPEVQVRAAEGLVNYYYPGYVKTGLSGSLQRAGNTIKGKFTDTNTQAIDPQVKVRDEVVAALGKLAKGGSSFEARAAAARGLGVLRGAAAVPELGEALRSRDSQVIYESLIALQKIRDAKGGPLITFLLSDLDDRILTTALETIGVLGNHEPLPQVRELAGRARNEKVRRAALTTLALLADESSRPVFEHYLKEKDDKLRASAAEGLGRLRAPADRERLYRAFRDEKKTGPKLSFALAAVLNGWHEYAPGTPLEFLVSQLKSTFWGGVAHPFLVEATRDAAVRQALYPHVTRVGKDERRALAYILAVSGDQQTVKYLEVLSADPDREVAAEGIRCLQILKSRL